MADFEEKNTSEAYASLEEEKRATVMIVDDNIANLRLNKGVLSDTYNVLTALSAAKMFELLEKFQAPDMILLDINMPVMDGYAAIRILKANPKTKDIPVIFLTGKTDPESEMKGFELGAIDFIIKPFLPQLLRDRVSVHLMVNIQRRSLERQVKIIDRQRAELQNFNVNLQKMVEDKAGKIMELQSVILKTLGILIEKRDDVTGGHVERVKKGVGILTYALLHDGVYKDEVAYWDIDLLLQSSQLHDIGKIAIHDNILLKPGKLSPDEFEEMKKHTTYGVEIIMEIIKSTSENAFLQYALAFAGTHHEKWDGTGYPKGLHGKSIPLQGRLLAIADVYDALVSQRPYKPAFPHSEAVKIILNGKGTFFDPTLVEIFEHHMDEFKG